MPLTDGLTAVVRTSEMINSDGTVGFSADRVVSPEDALAVAFAAVAGRPSRVARPSNAPVYQVKHPELAYAESLFPAEPLRLLGAFRIWSVFEWFSPYRHLMDSGWDTVLEEALSKFSAARNAQEYHLAVAEMVSHVNDTHSETSSSVLTEFWGNAAPAKGNETGDWLGVRDDFPGTRHLRTCMHPSQSGGASRGPRDRR